MVSHLPLVRHARREGEQDDEHERRADPRASPQSELRIATDVDLQLQD